MWAVDGCRSLQHWLGSQLGISSAEAARSITVARAFDTHPELVEMFLDGRLSIAQTALAVSVHPTRDHEIAELPVACTLQQLRVFAKAMQRSDAPRPAEDPEPRCEYFEFGLDHAGWLNGRFDLDPEHGRLVQHALEQCRDALFHERKADPPDDAEAERSVVNDPNRPARVRWVDALAEMARRGLDGEPSEVRRDRYRINMFIDLDTIIESIAAGEGEVDACWITRDGVPAWLAERVCCDGAVTPTFTRQGKPVSVGRSHRIVPERTRRLVLHRDGHKCRVPWCNRTRWLDVHHIVHWVNGGPTIPPTWPGCATAATTPSTRATSTSMATPTIHSGSQVRTDPLHPSEPAALGRAARPADVYVLPLGERLDRRDVLVSPSRVAS